MKTSKIIATIATLNLVLFMSVSSIANPVTGYEGDIVRTGVKKQIEIIKSAVTEIASPLTSGNELSFLRFDVNKFVHESKVAEQAQNITETVRFDVDKFINTNETEMSELPASTDFSKLRFDVNKYSDSTSVAIDELPVN